MDSESDKQVSERCYALLTFIQYSDTENVFNVFRIERLHIHCCSFFGTAWFVNPPPS